VLFNQGDEICRCVARQQGLGEVRIAGQEVLRPAFKVREIATAAARDQYFLSNPVRALKNCNPSPPLAGFNRTHQPGSASSHDENVAFVRQGQLKRIPGKAPSTLVILFPMSCSSLYQQDRALVQIVDAAFAEAARKSGSWIQCRPGCTQCCIGVFAINQLDATRLQQGMADLQARSPERATAVRERARTSIQRMAAEFPGDRRTGLLYEDKKSQRRFEDFANDEPCPALDPLTGRCELYEFRPMTCRIFGAPVRSEDGLGVCELCFQGATTDEITACELRTDTQDLESTLVQEAEKRAGTNGRTIVAYTLASQKP